MPVHAGARNVVAVANACRHRTNQWVSVRDRRVSAAKIGIEIFGLDAPVRSDHPLKSTANCTTGFGSRVGIDRAGLCCSRRCAGQTDVRIASFDLADGNAAGHEE